MKKILVTGANRGIGRSICLALDQKGYSLILHSRKQSDLKSLLEDCIHPELHSTVTADFSDDAALKSMIKEIKSQHKDDLYGIVNNAGIALDKPIAYQPEQEVDMMLKVNLKAPILIGKMAMKLFLTKKEGVIINIASCIGESGNAFQSVYAATKAGLVALSKSWAKEAGELIEEHKVRVLCVSPGFIKTDMTDQLSQGIQDEYKKNIPARKFGSPQDIANAICFLMSEEASYINGTEIKINGGIL